MGNTKSKNAEETLADVRDIINDRTTEYSFINLHGPSAGMGAVLIVGVIILGAVTFIIYKRCVNKSSTRRTDDVELQHMERDYRAPPPRTVYRGHHRQPAYSPQAMDAEQLAMMLQSALNNPRFNSEILHQPTPALTHQKTQRRVEETEDDTEYE